MNNVVRLRSLERAIPTDDQPISQKMFRSALRHMLAHSRGEGLENTAITLELALTALDVDYESRRG